MTAGRGQRAATPPAAPPAGTVPLPPRFLVRRLLAFALDHTLAVILVGLATMPFVNQGLRLPQPLLHLRTVTCNDLTQPPDGVLDHPETAQFTVLRLCESRLYGLPNGREIVAVYSHTDADTGRRLTRMVRVPVDPALRPRRVPDLSAAIVFVVMGALGAGLTARASRSAGMALLGLRLTGPGHPIRREVLRLGPLTLLALASALNPVPVLLWPFAAVVGAVAATVALLLGYYVWPLWRWRGQMPWDRWSGHTLTAS